MYNLKVWIWLELIYIMPKHEKKWFHAQQFLENADL